MGALSELLKRPDSAATPATSATRPPESGAESQESQESQGAAPENHARLLHLADAEGVDAAHVHRLHADDLAACEGLDDATLRGYLRALETAARMDAGMVPVEYSHAVQCEGCGPVWLWPDCPDKVKACPWCFRRRAGKRIPRPCPHCGNRRCVHCYPRDNLPSMSGPVTMPKR